jgi:glycosyltransferase involved in cell wall biosynthesis
MVFFKANQLKRKHSLMEKKTKELKRNSRRKITKFKKIDSAPAYNMVVFCHLRWGFVYQRPQHLISRMAQHYKILFVEEPIPFQHPDEENEYQLEIINDNLHVLKPKVRRIEDIKKVIKPLVQNCELEIGWFYSAAFSPLITNFVFDTVIYDCMDELTLFKGASPQLITQEKFLMAEAHIVFTGGKSLYDSKRTCHSNVHCFASSVDRSHFEKAMGEIEVPEDIKDIKKPVVGYFGVIDERINLDLLQETARMLPDVGFAMIGPLAKIDEEELPREDNIYYLGMKSYNDLPNYLKAFDIAMMPFALNDATKYISPTKTLEYMAAGKPIISTAIKDVVSEYGHCIPIIENAEDFAHTIDHIWHIHQEDHSAEYNDILEKTSWDETAYKMLTIIKTSAE